MELSPIWKDTFLQILREELRPAMGCTEPIAIAYAAAKARAVLRALPERLRIAVSGNIIKNVKSVVVPHTGGQLRHAHFFGQIAGIVAIHHNGPWIGGLYLGKPRSVLWIKSVVQIKVKRLGLPAPALAPERQPCNAVPQVVLIL